MFTFQQLLSDILQNQRIFGWTSIFIGPVKSITLVDLVGPIDLVTSIDLVNLIKLLNAIESIKLVGMINLKN
jgi:hypothetical protein